MDRAAVLRKNWVMSLLCYSRIRIYDFHVQNNFWLRSSVLLPCECETIACGCGIIALSFYTTVAYP